MTINNNISENIVSFEIAKLLKDKKFEVHTRKVYNEHGKLLPFNHHLLMTGERFNAPTQQIAIEWILDNFNIVINVVPNNAISSIKSEAYIVFIWIIYTDSIDHITLMSEDEDGDEDVTNFVKIEEGKTAALIYILKNMIKTKS